MTVIASRSTARMPAQRLGCSSGVLGRRDGGEAVTGADHLHGGALVAGPAHDADDRGDRVGRLAPGAARPTRGPTSCATRVPVVRAPAWRVMPRRVGRAAAARVWAHERAEDAAAERDAVGGRRAVGSTTSPARLAPGATPATSPVCKIAMPSVSRPAGTTGSISDIARSSSGAIAKPPTNSTTRHQRHATRRTAAAPSPAPCAEPQRSRTLGSAAPVDRAGDQAGDEAAERPRPPAARRRRPCGPARRRRRPWSPRPRRRARRASGRRPPAAARSAPRHRRSRRRGVGGCAGRRLGAALGGEGEGPDAAR